MFYHSPICYLPQWDPTKDTLENKNKATQFKMTLPKTRNELKVVKWASRIPEQFLMHVSTAVHTCKQMDLEANFKEA